MENLMSNCKNGLVLVRGVPGSGKTTFAKKLVKDLGFIHHEADHWFELTGEYVFEADKLYQAHKSCQTLTRASLKNDKSNVVVANTFTRIKEMQFYIDLAKELNVPLVVFRMETSYGSIHNVPAETILKMRERFEDYPGETIISVNDESI